MEIYPYKILFLIISTILIVSCSGDKKSEQVSDLKKDSAAIKPNVMTVDSNETYQIDVPVDSLKPLTFTKSDIDQIVETGNAPFVKNLRKAFNHYLSGRTESEYLELSATQFKEGNLTMYDRSYYKSKFFVLKITDNAMGGINMEILFRDKQDKVFTVWMFESENFYKLRIIFENLDYNKNEIAATKRLFTDIFKRNDCAF